MNETYEDWEHEQKLLAQEVNQLDTEFQAHKRSCTKLALKMGDIAQKVANLKNKMFTKWCKTTTVSYETMNRYRKLSEFANSVTVTEDGKEKTPRAELEGMTLTEAYNKAGILLHKAEYRHVDSPDDALTPEEQQQKEELTKKLEALQPVSGVSYKRSNKTPPSAPGAPAPLVISKSETDNAGEDSEMNEDAGESENDTHSDVDPDDQQEDDEQPEAVQPDELSELLLGICKNLLPEIKESSKRAKAKEILENAIAELKELTAVQGEEYDSLFNAKAEEAA